MNAPLRNNRHVEPISRCVGKVIVGIADCVSAPCVCPCSERKTPCAINTKLGTHVRHGRTHDLGMHSHGGQKGQRSRSRGYVNRHGCPVTSGGCMTRVLLVPAWGCMSVRLQVCRVRNDFCRRVVVLRVRTSHSSSVHRRCRSSTHLPSFAPLHRRKRG